MFFEELCESLKDITVRDDEAGFARQLESIGVTLKDGFQYDKLDAATVAGLKRAVLDGQTIAAYYQPEERMYRGEYIVPAVVKK
jgi:hypothetical protein